MQAVFDETLYNIELTACLHILNKHNKKYNIAIKYLTPIEFFLEVYKIDADNKCYNKNIKLYSFDDFKERFTNKDNTDDIQRCNSIKEAIIHKKLLPIPFLNYTNFGLNVDGCHRMWVCYSLFGDTQTFPILTITKETFNG